MPAHRSDAEAEIRSDVVAALRRWRPDARIMHEVNIGGGKNRADVLAVSRAEIIMVEIKSAKDKLDRLTDQIGEMQRAAHVTVAALDRKFLPEITTTFAPSARDMGLPFGTLIWWHPKAQDMAEAHHEAFRWWCPDPGESLNVPLPSGALQLLHRDELLAMAEGTATPAPLGANMMSLRRALLWNCTGRDLTRGICRALRLRTLAAEADPALTQDAA